MTPIAEYADVVMANGAKDYFDILNIHAYRPISSYAQIMEDIRNYLKRHDIADRPVWFTENGTDSEGSGRIPSYIAGLKAHSPEQELLVAELLPKIMIHMQSLGVDRDFFFVLPPYSERDGNKDWGLMRRGFTGKAGYAALGTLVDQLGNAAPEGEVRLGDGLKGFLYRRKEGGKVLAYWCISELDTDKPRPGLSNADLKARTFALPLSGDIRGVDLVGTPFTAEAGRIPATRYPAFLTGVDALRADLPFHAPQAVLRPDRESAFDKTVIFRAELSGDFQIAVGKDCADVKKTPARFRLQVWNLSDREKRGTLAASGGSVTGIPAGVTLPPFTGTRPGIQRQTADRRRFQRTQGDPAGDPLPQRHRDEQFGPEDRNAATARPRQLAEELRRNRHDRT